MPQLAKGFKMENVFEGSGEIIRDGKDFLLVFSKELAEKADLVEGGHVFITIEQGVKIKLTKPGTE